MGERKFGRIVNITSSAVKAPIPVLGLSNGARSGLHGFVAGVSRQVAKTGVTINNLLPGRFLTDRLKGTIGAQSKRSEEHTSELQSLMRISYAVVRLKKKK